MAPTKIKAIVLKKNNFRETSVILSLYTKEYGKVKCVLKGVRTEKSRVPPLVFMPGSCIFAFFYMRRSELGLLSTPSLIDSYQMDLKRNFVAWSVILNLVNLFTPEKEKEEELYLMLQETGKMLSELDIPEIIFVCFKIKLIKILGYGIELNRCIICRNETNITYFSGKLGGVICNNCRVKDIISIRMPLRILNVMRQLEKINFYRLRAIKKIPKEILLKMNFYSNVILNYHVGLNHIWWEDEKNILC